MRWGTNVVTGTSTVLDTEAFYTSFTETGGTTHEAQAANGDSGGAVFIKDGSLWELAGVMFAVGEYLGQPAETALYGNLTYAADLASYRDQIIEIARPQCSDEVDNDGDDLVDFPADPDCSDSSDPSESPPVPSLVPWGRALVAGLLVGSAVWVLRRRRPEGATPGSVVLVDAAARERLEGARSVAPLAGERIRDRRELSVVRVGGARDSRDDAPDSPAGSTGSRPGSRR